MKKILLLLLAFSGLSAYAQNVVFADENLKNYFLDEYDTVIDTNGDREIQVSEARAVTTLQFSGKNGAGVPYTSFQGIEAFTNINDYFYTESEDIGLTNFDLSNYPVLSFLIINTYRFSGYTPPPSIEMSSITYQVTSNPNLRVYMPGRNVSLKGSTLESFSFGYGLEYVSLELIDGPDVLDLSFFPGTRWDMSPSYIIELGGTDLLILHNGWQDLDASVNLTTPGTYVCVDFDDQDNVNVTSQFPFTVGPYCSFNMGAYNVSGTITMDVDGNGCTSNNPVVPYFPLTGSQSSLTGTITSNSEGYYNFSFPQEYDVFISELQQNSWFSSVYTSFSFYDPFGEVNNSQQWDICLTPIGVHNDVEVVVTPVSDARPGFDAYYKILYKNKGNQTLNGTLSLTYNNTVLDYLDSLPEGVPGVGGNLSWEYTNLRPFEQREITVILNLNSPVDTPPVSNGDILHYTVGITPLTGDETPADNTFMLKQTVVGSFDPNDIACLEGASVHPDAIGDYLHYTVNFENTGTAAATFVVVKDAIDIAKYDINSLQVLNASHNMYTRVYNNTIEFIFEDINLAANGGKGNVTFKIKTRPDLQVNSNVTQKADIHFDYNFPIVTNNATTVFEVLGTDILIKDSTVKVYPNPVKNIVNISAASVVKSLQVYDLQGRLLLSQQCGTTTAQLNLANRAAGVYFVKISTEKGASIQKVIKE